MKKWMKLMSVSVAMLACMSAKTATAARYDQEIAASRPSKEANEEVSNPLCGQCGGDCKDGLCKMQQDSSCCEKKHSKGGSMDQQVMFKEQSRKNNQPKSAARAAVEGE